MEAKVAAVEVRVENLESRFEKHEDDDARFHKYNSHMLEDLISKIAQIELSAARFEADLMHRAGNDKDTKARLDGISERLDTVRRLVWMAIGAVSVFTALVTFMADNLMRVLGAK